MPHWDGCKERGPETLRVFSNCEVMRVIMPSAAINDSRESTADREQHGRWRISTSIADSLFLIHLT